MQTRRAFLVNGAVNLIAVAVGGTLVVTAKEQVKEKIDKQIPEVPKKPTISQATDFALGGTLGFITKKVIEKSIGLKRVNKELTSTVSKLQKLEKNDLTGIEKTLQEFVRNEGIRYEANKDNNLIDSITGLLNAILIHVNAQKPYLEGLQKLGDAFAQPCAEVLLHDGNIDNAIQTANNEAFRGSRLAHYIEDIIIRAFERNGIGEEIGRRTVDSLAETVKECTISDDIVIAFKQTITEALQSRPFIEAVTYAMSAGMTEYDIAYKLVRHLLQKFKISLKSNDPDIIALKDTIAESIKSKVVSKQLDAAVERVVGNPTA